MLSEFEVFPFGTSFNFLRQQSRMQLDEGRARRCRTHHLVSPILKYSEVISDGHKLGSPFSFHCRYQISLRFEGEVEYTVHLAVFRLTETVHRSLSWSFSLISARTRNHRECGISKNPSVGSFSVTAG